MRWTDAKIRSYTLPDAQKQEQRVAVDDGLYLRLWRTRRGISKRFEYRAQVNGKRRYLMLGEYSARFGLASAREKLSQLRATEAEARAGIADHPAIEERFRREGRRSDPTFSQFFEEFLEDKRLGTRRTGKPARERTLAIHRENFRKDVGPRIGDAKVSTIKREALQACIDHVRRRGALGQAQQVYRTLRALVRYAIERAYLVSDPMAGIRAPKPYNPRQGEANAASDSELAALLLVLRQSKRVSKAARLAAEMQILTGTRPSEVRLAQWHEFDLDKKQWRLVADRTKTDRSLDIHLSDAALSILDEAKSIPSPQGYVFSGRTGGPLDKLAVGRMLARLEERLLALGAKRLRPHDLRRCFRTLAARLGVPPHVAQRCLNQTDHLLGRVYDAHDYRSEMVDAWNRVGARVQMLSYGVQPPHCTRMEP